MRAIAYFAGFTLAACAIVALLNECHAHELSHNPPTCWDYSDRCLDEWYAHGDDSGDYGPIDEACDEMGEVCTPGFERAYAEYLAR